jgi:hypothetical protein
MKKEMKWMKRYVDTNFKLDRKAVDQYSKTNDEWKTLHNGLQRKMEEDRNQYVTREMLNKQSLLIISVIGLLVTLYEVFIK